VNQPDLRAAIVAALNEAAPDVGGQPIDPAVAFRDQFRIDSVDFLNFVMALERRLDRHVPELDYPKLSTLNGCLRYFNATGDSA
jgi:acyl carrier protein